MIIGLDVGGTHTDTVLLDENGVVKERKVPTDPSLLFETILYALEETLAGVPLGRLQRVVLSTTLTTNAIVEDKLEPVGMLVAAGPGIDPEAFRIGAFYHVVDGVVDHRGREIRPVNRAQIEALADRLQNSGIRQAGVAAKFSVRSPAHEIQIGRILERRGLHVFLGHRLSGSLNFPRRIATTYLNAAVYPIHHAFYQAVQKSLEQKGIHCPIHILKADGGTMSFSASLAFPAQTALSGPAASVMGACAFADRCSECLVLDIGGTTTDMAVLIGGVPLMNPLGIDLHGHKTLIRALGTQSIGIGGDSCVKIDDGRLSIGPQRRGPAMAYGGPAPTPTDALFVLRRTTGGSREKAADGFQPIAEALGTDIETAAETVFTAASNLILSAAHSMINEINCRPVYTVHELLDGWVVEPHQILLMGGPAPHFARHFSSAGQYRVRTVPKYGVANAIGAALARTTCAVTLYADTEAGVVRAPAENFTQAVDADFSSEAMAQTAFDLLRRKAGAMGAPGVAEDMEIVESSTFNMVRGFYTVGKNMRMRVQIKPGLIPEHARILQSLQLPAADSASGADHPL